MLFFSEWDGVANGTPAGISGAGVGDGAGAIDVLGATPAGVLGVSSGGTRGGVSAGTPSCTPQDSSESMHRLRQLKVSFPQDCAAC